MASLVQRWWEGLDKPGWRSFAVAMALLAVAMVLALYSAAAAEMGRIYLAGGSALAALGLAFWVGVTIVPKLARRTPLRWRTRKEEGVPQDARRSLKERCLTTKAYWN
jgi:hypothetical protein